MENWIALGLSNYVMRMKLPKKVMSSAQFPHPPSSRNFTSSILIKKPH